MGQETELLDKQLLSQMLEAIRVTPSLHEDLQVEVMKVRSPASSMSPWRPPRKSVLAQIKKMSLNIN